MRGPRYVRVAGRFAVCLVSVAVLLSPTVSIRGAQDPGDAPKKVMGRILCEGRVSYRAGFGPWITPSGGTHLVVTPLSVRTNETHSRIILESAGIFEPAAQTQMEITQPEEDSLTVVLREGAFLYALPQERVLRIVVPTAGVDALAGAAQEVLPAKPSAAPVASHGGTAVPGNDRPAAFAGRNRPDPVFSSVAHMGVIELAEGPSVKLYNLRGTLFYRADDEQMEAVAVGGAPERVEASSRAEKPTARSADKRANSPASTADAPPPDKVFFVATDGDDVNGDGSETRPWATITRALDSVADGSTITVRAGTYTGRVHLHGSFPEGVVVKSEDSYRALLRHNGAVVTCYDAQGITLQGFDISHSGPGAGPRIVHIRDRSREPGMADFISTITLTDNIIHDSYNRDLVAIENTAGRVTVIGNLFYNQSGPHAHIDVNSATATYIQDNVFFNDFEGSGRANNNDTGSYVVIRDDDGMEDSTLGSREICVQRNVFLNWEGSPDACFVQIGKDGKPYHEARDVLVENSLMLGNSPNVIRAPFAVFGGRDITFRHNTIAGDLPSHAYAMYLTTVGQNPPNEDLAFYNNLWSDPTETMGALDSSLPNDFSDAPPTRTLSFDIDHNAYWNGDEEIPNDPEERVNPTDDATSSVGNPLLGRQRNVKPPRWDPSAGRFANHAKTIRKAHERIVRYYGAPAKVGRPVIDVADQNYAPREDILYRKRPEGAGSDIGCYEQSRLVLWWWASAAGLSAGVLLSDGDRDHHSPSKP